MADLRRGIKRVALSLAPNVSGKLLRTRRAHIQRLQEAEHWRIRIADAMACPDNERLPRTAGAGTVTGQWQTMFNGLQVLANGYYGTYLTELLRRNRGSHEPQEELVFLDVLRCLGPGATMVECGAYWGFYSLWFARDVPGGSAWLIEPNAANLETGRRNFQRNGLRAAAFIESAVGQASAEGKPSAVSIDDFLQAHGIRQLQILHADIQGAEVEMLRGARKSLESGRIDYIFLSTHGNLLHEDCVRLLSQYHYQVPISLTPEQSYSFDGLIVSHRSHAAASGLPVPSSKPTHPGNQGRRFL
jgi:hypothetical protein